jgi:hypothetical protein
MQFQRKMLPPVLMGSTLIAVLLTSSFASTMFMHRVVYAQDSNSSGFGNTTNLALPSGKSIPINYLINTGKLLDLTLDKSRATLRVLIC